MLRTYVLRYRDKFFVNKRKFCGRNVNKMHEIKHGKPSARTATMSSGRAGRTSCEVLRVCITGTVMMSYS